MGSLLYGAIFISYYADILRLECWRSLLDTLTLMGPQSDSSVVPIVLCENDIRAMLCDGRADVSFRSIFMAWSNFVIKEWFHVWCEDDSSFFESVFNRSGSLEPGFVRRVLIPDR